MVDGALSVPATEEPRSAREERYRRSLAAHAAFFFRHPSPLMIATLAAVTAGLRVVAGPVGLEDLVVVAVVGAYWPAQEWFLHKFLLHMRPRKLFGVTLDPEFARAHRAHHRQPWIVETTFLPTRVVLALVPITVLAWLAITPSVPLALTGMVAYASAAVLYEWTHYLTHSAYVPRTAYVARIVRNHRLHHFKNERFWVRVHCPRGGHTPSNRSSARSDRQIRHSTNTRCRRIITGRSYRCSVQ